MDSRNKQLAGNTAILLIGRICTQFINFLMLPLYTALLAPAEYGIVDLFNTYVTLFLPIVSLHLDLGLFRFMLDVRDDYDKQKTLFSSALYANILCCVGYSLLYLAFNQWIHSEYRIFLLLHVVLNVISSLLLQFARGLGHNAAYSFGSFLSALVTVSMNVVLIAIIRVGAVGLFWSVVCGQCALILYLILSQKVWKYASLQNVHLKGLKPVLKYSLPLIPTNLAWWVVSASDRTVISYFLSVADNGIFSVASKFSALINVFYTIFNMAWTETVVLHIDDEDRDVFLTNTVNELFNFFFCICICVLAVMPFVFPWFVNEQYKDAYNLIPILMIGVFCSIVCGLFSVFFMAKKDTKENAKTAVFAAIINLAIDISLITRIGLYAAALSTFIAYLAMAIYRYICIQKYINLVICKKNLITSILISAVVCGSYYLQNTIICVLVLVFTIIYSVYINKTMILGLKNTITSFINRDGGKAE